MDETTKTRLRSKDPDEFLAGCWSLLHEVATGPSFRHVPHFQLNVTQIIQGAGLVGPTTDPEFQALHKRIEDATAILLLRGFLTLDPTQVYLRFAPGAAKASADDVLRGWPPDHLSVDRFDLSSWTDATLATYFKLSVRTFEAHVPEAALFFLGGAGERLVDVGIERVKHLATKAAPIKAGDRCAFLFETLDKAIKAKAMKLPVDELAALLQRGDHPITIGGRMSLDLEKTARIRPLFNVTVFQVHKRPGETVRKGDNILTVESTDLGTAKNNYLTQIANLEVAATTYRREALLRMRHATTDVDYENARSAFRQAAVALMAAREQCMLMGVRPQELEELRGELYSEVLNFARAKADAPRAVGDPGLLTFPEVVRRLLEVVAAVT